VEAGEVTSSRPAPATTSPHGRLCGAVSVWLATYQDRDSIDDVMRSGPAHAWHAWLVTESVPLGYGDNRTWPLGTRSPGLSQLTLFDKHPSISEDRFYHLWHDVHRRTTAEVHPLWCYVRNEIVRPLTAGAPSARGIVYQSVADPQDMLEPARMFRSGGDEARLQANAQRVVDETKAFIDYETMQTVHMHEYLVRVVST